MERDTILQISLIALLALSGIFLGYILPHPEKVVLAAAPPDLFDLYGEPITNNHKAIEIAKAFAITKTYDEDTYNCLNFSEDLVAFYNQSGYSARVVTGWLAHEDYCEVGKLDDDGKIDYKTIMENDCLGAHAWVVVRVPVEIELPIEATTGELIDSYEVKQSK